MDEGSVRRRGGDTVPHSSFPGDVFGSGGGLLNRRKAHGIPLKNVLNILIGITVVNGIPEAVISGVIITPIVLALEKSGWKA